MSHNYIYVMTRHICIYMSYEYNIIICSMTRSMSIVISQALISINVYEAIVSKSIQVINNVCVYIYIYIYIYVCVCVMDDHYFIINVDVVVP